ncbi:MAG TPA: BatD family protein [Verrucomicrobiota bacterium]|nr:BatD family protein [Verrucomicrobiota bacterium]
MFGWRAVADPSFTAALQPEAVGAGEVATLKLIFTDLGDVAAPTLPPLTNCTVQYQGQSSQISIVNFSKSSSIIHQYAVQAKSPGLVSIPALAVKVDGKTYTSTPLTLRVGQGFDLNSVGFLRVLAPRSEMYVGETFPLEIRFYYRTAPTRQVPPTIKLDGFVKGRQNVENLQPETLTNVVFSVVRWSMAVTAVKAGDLTVGPAEFQTLYTFERQGRRSRGFDALFEPFFGGGAEQRQLTFTSEPFTLRVVNPPAAGRPPGFNGAVGRFKMAVTASPTNVVVGDPVTLRVQVSGQGNFDGLSLPDLPSDSGFQSYPGTNTFAEGDPLGLSGVKTFEVVVVPEQPGLQALKWPWLPYWDPGAKAYAVDQPSPLWINVRPGASAQAQPAGKVPATESAVPRTANAGPGELALLQTLGPLVSMTPSRVTQPWFWGVVSLPLFAYAAAILVPLWHRRRAEDPEKMTRAAARRAVAEHLAELEDCAKTDRPAAFFAALNDAVQQQLALTLGGSPGTFTEEVIETRLVPAGLGPEECVRLRGLFQRLAEARFSPTVAGGELELMRKETEGLIAALRVLEEAA